MDGSDCFLAGTYRYMSWHNEDAFSEVNLAFTGRFVVFTRLINNKIGVKRKKTNLCKQYIKSRDVDAVMESGT